MRGSVDAARADFEAAKQLARSGDALRALQLFEKVASSPLRAYVEQELDAQMAACVERLAEIGQTAQVFAGTDPVRTARLLARAAVRLFHAGEHARAARAFEALYSQPASPGLGNVHLAFDVAVARAAAGDPTTADWVVDNRAAVADVLRERGLSDLALAPGHQAAKSMAAQPETPVTIDGDVEIAIESFQRGAIADALRGFETARARDPSDELAFDAAMCLALLGRFDEALTVAGEAGGLAEDAVASLIGGDIIEPTGILASHW